MPPTEPLYNLYLITVFFNQQWWPETGRNQKVENRVNQNVQECEWTQLSTEYINLLCRNL